MIDESVHRGRSQGRRHRPNRRVYARTRKRVGHAFNNIFESEADFRDIEKEFQRVEELEEVASMELKDPKFPILMFSIALVIDLMGFLDFTALGAIIMPVIEIILFIILTVWMMGRVSMIFKSSSKFLFKGRVQRMLTTLLRRRMRQYLSRRLIAICIVKLIPFIGILASSAFFVFLAYNKEKKIVQQYTAFINQSALLLKEYYRISSRF